MSDISASANLYVSLSGNYASAANSINSAQNSIDNAVDIICSLDNPDVKVELLRPVEQGLANYSIDTSTLLTFVRTLNNHVLKRNSIDTLDNFFAAAGIKVDASWADLCSQAGFLISSKYIK